LIKQTAHLYWCVTLLAMQHSWSGGICEVFTHQAKIQKCH